MNPNESQYMHWDWDCTSHKYLFLIFSKYMIKYYIVYNFKASTKIL